MEVEAISLIINDPFVLSTIDGGRAVSRLNHLTTRVLRDKKEYLCSKELRL